MGKIKWNLNTMNEFCKECNNGYKVLEIKHINKEYQKNQLWALIKCPNEYHKPYWVFWNQFRKGHGCMKCYRLNNNMEIWNPDMAYSFCKSYGYVMLDKNDFVNVDKCFYCYDKNGFIKNISISNLKRIINKTKSCYGFSIIKNNKYAKYNIDLYCALYRPEYEFLSDIYKGVKEAHTFKYNGEFLRDESYGREFECTIDGFLHGDVGHPFLTKSLGEITTENYLIKNNIDYICQYRFSDCKDKQTLPFDFAIIKNGIIKCVIEYQGRQHYESIEFFGGDKSFKYTQKHDQIKNEYCKKNNIPLICIPYWEREDLEYYLFDQLVRLGIIEEIKGV